MKDKHAFSDLNLYFNVTDIEGDWKPLKALPPLHVMASFGDGDVHGGCLINRMAEAIRNSCVSDEVGGWCYVMIHKRTMAPITKAGITSAA